MTAYEKVKAARDPARPTATDYINSIFTAFTEMHGDRRFSDDAAVVTGLALLGSMPVTVIGLEKGHDIKERVARNFGCAHPEGYRKALRQMKLAEKFRRPVVCFVDTAGAYCGIGAEERGQAQAIAENLYEMSALKTPIVSVFIGEGGSGGALGLAVADEVWKDPAKVADAAECLKLTASDLYSLGVIDRILLETGGESVVFSTLKVLLARKLRALCAVDPAELTEKRYDRFRAFGNFLTL